MFDKFGRCQTLGGLPRGIGVTRLRDAPAELVSPIRDARFVDLILADRRQERVWRAQRPGAKIEAIATSTGGRDRIPGT